jgi:hypothetical protein
MLAIPSSFLVSSTKLFLSRSLSNFKFSVGMTLAGFFSALFLPETLHQKLPNTIQEAVNFGKNQKFWQLPKKPAKIPDEGLELRLNK